MELIEMEESPISGRKVEKFRLTSNVDMSDIDNIINLLNTNNITIENLSLKSSGEDVDHFFRVYSDLQQFNGDFPPENVDVDKFAVSCLYNNTRFSLSFSLFSGEVITTKKENINLEPLLLDIEQLCQKKNRAGRI